MKKVFQTGLAFGNENGACEACNLNYSWLFNTPSTLLWIDKVVVTKPVWDIIMAPIPEGPIDDESKHGLIVQKTARLTYEILDSVGLVERVESNEIGEEETNLIYDQVEEDLELLKSVGEIQKEDGHLYYMNKMHYCIPSLWTLYASMLYSRKHNCNFTLDESDLFYLRKLIPYKLGPKTVVSRKSAAINEVLEMTLPWIRIWPEYVYVDKQSCEKCRNLVKCDDGYLTSVEKRLFRLLEDREKDEVKEFCLFLDHICDEKFKDAFEISPDDLVRELNIEKVKIQQKLQNVYKKIGRWSKIVTTISAALSLGYLFKHPELTAIGGISGIASQAASRISDYYQQKYKWVNFVNKGWAEQKKSW